MFKIMSIERYERLKVKYNQMRDDYKYFKQLADEGQVDQTTLALFSNINLNQKQEIKNLNSALVRKDYSNKKLANRVKEQNAAIKKLHDQIEFLREAAFELSAVRYDVSEGKVREVSKAKVKKAAKKKLR